MTLLTAVLWYSCCTAKLNAFDLSVPVWCTQALYGP